MLIFFLGDESQNNNNSFALSLCTDAFETNFYQFDKQLTIAEKLLISLYSVCPKTGFYAMGTSLLSDETLKNPERGDNNSGITVIDLRGDVKYCFMRLKQSESALDSFEAYQPIKAVDYINALSYIEEQSAYKSDPIWNEQHKLKLLDKISKVDLLALSECQKLFPSLYK